VVFWIMNSCKGVCNFLSPMHVFFACLKLLLIVPGSENCFFLTYIDKIITII
jgi:hypothetical protein